MEDDEQLAQLARRAQLLDEHLKNESAIFLERPPEPFAAAPQSVAIQTTGSEALGAAHQQLDANDNPSPPSGADESEPLKDISISRQIANSVIFHGRIYIDPDDTAVARCVWTESLVCTHVCQVYYINGAACYDRDAKDLPWYLGVGITWFARGYLRQPDSEELWRHQRYPIPWKENDHEERPGLKAVEYALSYALQARLRDLSQHRTQGPCKIFIFTDCNVEQLRAILDADRCGYTNLQALADGDPTMSEIHKLTRWLYGYASLVEIHSVPNTMRGGMAKARYQGMRAALMAREIAVRNRGEVLKEEKPCFVVEGDRKGGA